MIVRSALPDHGAPPPASDGIRTAMRRPAVGSLIPAAWGPMRRCSLRRAMRAREWARRRDRSSSQAGTSRRLVATALWTTTARRRQDGSALALPRRRDCCFVKSSSGPDGIPAGHAAVRRGGLALMARRSEQWSTDPIPSRDALQTPARVPRRCLRSNGHRRGTSPGSGPGRWVQAAGLYLRPAGTRDIQRSVSRADDRQ